MVNRATSPWIEAEPVVVASLAKIGIMVEVQEAENHYTIIQTVANETPIGMNPGWGKDYPDSSARSSDSCSTAAASRPRGTTTTRWSASAPSQATELGVAFGPTPSVDADIDNCKNDRPDQ